MEMTRVSGQKKRYAGYLSMHTSFVFEIPQQRNPETAIT